MAHRIIVIAIITMLSTVSAAQVIYGTPTAWFAGTSCPATWVALTPSETQPADPARYVVTAANGAQFQMLDAAVERAFTVSGVLNQAALDAALAAGIALHRVEGRAARIRCSWRPVGGQP